MPISEAGGLVPQKSGLDRLTEKLPVQIREIRPEDIETSLREGWQDFLANRTDVIFLCLVYPVIGVVLAQLLFNNALLPLVFPLVSGFALVGPVAGIGLYDLSRRREMGEKTRLSNVFDIVRSPARVAVGTLALGIVVLFMLWLAAATLIYLMTIGGEAPASTGAFLRTVFTTGAGWAMIVVGVGVGFLFAVAVLSVGVFAFPLMIDKNLGVGDAVRTSIAAVRANPRTMALWGLTVAGILVVASLPFLIGLVIAIPVLGHATWHLYRKLVPKQP